ncbi:MAG: CoA-binding protein [Pseudomonadota bacterium]
MIRKIEDSPLALLVNPRSMVMFGASNNLSMGTVIYMAALNLKFKGPIYLVHPKDEVVLGRRAYKNIADLPEVPDLAVLVLPNRAVAGTIEACGRLGVRRAVIVSGGFKEAGEEGRTMEKELAETAARYGVRLLGPNCLGVLSTPHNLNTTTFPYEGPGGWVGMISRSGSFIVQMYQNLFDLGLGFSTAFSVGNQVDLDVVDCLEYLGACPHTKVIAMYIEGIRRGRDFVEAARAISPRKPIVAYYAGGSETGRRAGLSHTGALAGPDRLYDGVFRQGGIVRARTVTEMLECCRLLGGCPLPRGPRVAIQTDSGGPGAAAADACGRAGLELPSFSASTLAKLKDLIPGTASTNNPVDLTFNKSLQDYASSIPQALLDDENVDMLLAYFLMPVEVMSLLMEGAGLSKEQAFAESWKIFEQQGDSFGRLCAAADKPAVAFTYRALNSELIKILSARGVPVLTGPDRAARAMASLVEYRRLREKIIASDQSRAA